MDNLTLEALVRELQPRLFDTVIQKIRMADGRTLVFQLRSKQTQFLQVVLHPMHFGLFIIDALPHFQTTADDAVATLRKYLLGAKITGVRKEMSDRVVHLELETYRHSASREVFLLTLEFIPNRARILLLDTDHGVIVALPNRNVEISSRYRYSLAGKEDRVDLIDRKRFEELLSAFGTKEVWRHIFGLSPVWVQEILCRSGPKFDHCWEELQALLKQVREGPYFPRLYKLEPVAEKQNGLERNREQPVRVAARKSSSPPSILLPLQFHSLSSADSQTYSSMNEAAIDWHHSTTGLQPLSENVKSELRQISLALKKKQRLQENLSRDLERNLNATNFKLYADLLYAQPHGAVKGSKALTVVNLFDPALSEITIPLDPQYSRTENANQYARLYRKSNRSIPIIRNRIKRLQSEIESLKVGQQTLLCAKPQLPDKEFLVEEGGSRPKAHLKPSGSSRVNVNVSEQIPEPSLKRVAREFVSSEGLQILVGRSSKDNDTLTQKVARNEDFWLHVAGYGGSHVVLRNPAKLAVAPKQSLLEAAQLAAFFSQARNAPKVEVHYTQRRFVSKPRGAKPGLVYLKEYKAISARPQLLLGKTEIEP